MATFSENQVRHLFVGTKSGAISASEHQVGTIKAMADKGKNYLWFSYLGAGGLVSSDKIKLTNVVSATAHKSSTMKRPLNRLKVSLVENEVQPGQDYLLKVLFRQYIGMSDEDTYMKQGMVHGVKAMTKDKFYKTMAISLAKNLSRDENILVKIFVHSASETSGKFNSEGLTEVTARHTVNGGSSDNNNNWYGASSVATDIDYLLLEEVEQPWLLGRIPVSKISVEAYSDTIISSGDEILWGNIEPVEPKNFITNGKEIADLEYFCMGERGDIYRGVGWPYVINTKYIVDPSKNYDVIDITYFYAGDNEDIQKSQKTITIVADDTSNTIIKAIIADIKSVAGLNIELEPA